MVSGAGLPWQASSFVRQPEWRLPKSKPPAPSVRLCAEPSKVLSGKTRIPCSFCAQRSRAEPRQLRFLTGSYESGAQFHPLSGGLGMEVRPLSADAGVMRDRTLPRKRSRRHVPRPPRMAWP